MTSLFFLLSLCLAGADLCTIVYSLISGPQTFSDFFYIWKFAKKLFCAINVQYIYFLKMCLVWKYGEYNKSYERGSRKCHLEVLSIFIFGIVRLRVGRVAANFYPQLLKNRFLQPVYLLRIVIQLVEMLACLLPCSGGGGGGGQTNDLSHAAFTQARPNSAKIMAPRWRHDRAKSFPCE